MFSRDFIQSHVDYPTLSNTCPGGQACLEPEQIVAPIDFDSDSDKDTEILETCVSLPQYSYPLIVLR